MNREQRRKMERASKSAIRKSGFTPQQQKAYIDLVEGYYKNDTIPEGTKVKINYQAIEERTNGEMGFVFSQWLNAHKDDIFTLQYEEQYNEKKILACLAEDESDPKWLFWKGDLIPLESE